MASWFVHAAGVGQQVVRETAAADLSAWAAFAHARLLTERGAALARRR